MRTIADDEVIGDFNSLFAQAIKLADQIDGVDDHAIPDDACLSGTEDARRNQVENILLISNNHRVTGIVSALAANDDIGLIGEKIDNLSRAFVE
jgi:hypothetical protein